MHDARVSIGWVGLFVSWAGRIHCFFAVYLYLDGWLCVCISVCLCLCVMCECVCALRQSACAYRLVVCVLRASGPGYYTWPSWQS